MKFALLLLSFLPYVLGLDCGDFVVIDTCNDENGCIWVPDEEDVTLGVCVAAKPSPNPKPAPFGPTDCSTGDGDEATCLGLDPDCKWLPGATAAAGVCVDACDTFDNNQGGCDGRADCMWEPSETDGKGFCVDVVPVVPDCCPCEVPAEYLYNAKVTLNSTCVTSMLANQAMCEVECQEGLADVGSVNITCDNGVLLYNDVPDFFASELVCACPVDDIGEVSFDGCPCNKGYKGSGTCAEGSMCSDIGHKHEYICVKKYSKCTVGELGCPCLEDNTCLKDKKDKPLVCTQVLDVASGKYEATCAVSSGKKSKGGSYGSSSSYSSYSSREKGGDYYRDSYRPRSRHTHYYP